MPKPETLDEFIEEAHWSALFNFAEQLCGARGMVAHFRHTRGWSAKEVESILRSASQSDHPRSYLGKIKENGKPRGSSRFVARPPGAQDLPGFWGLPDGTKIPKVARETRRTV